MSLIASRRISFLLPGVLLAALACKSSSTEPTSSTTAPPPTSTPATVTNEYSVDAEVVAISQPERRITFRRSDGVVFDVVAGEAVRNFDQITVGKQLRVRYRESLTATLLPPGEELKVTHAAYASARAPVGAQPAAGAGLTIGMRVRVTAIDRENQVVTYLTPSDDFGARKIRTEKGREFVKYLKVGDIVQLDLQQSLALKIDQP